MRFPSEYLPPGQFTRLLSPRQNGVFQCVSATRRHVFGTAPKHQGFVRRCERISRPMRGIGSFTPLAMQLLLLSGLNKEALTTAWFYEVQFKWFKIMTSCTTKLAISRLDDVKYEDTVSFLRDDVTLFESEDLAP